MASSSIVQRKEAIFKLLLDNNVKKITLTGYSGVGKTWTAKLVSEEAVKQNLFDIALWIFPDCEYNEPALRESIARQLSLLPFAEEWNAQDHDNEEEEQVENNENLQVKIADSVAKKRLLLILDYEGKTEVDEGLIISKLETMLSLEEHGSYRFIINRVNGNASTGTQGVVPVEPLSVEESRDLLRETVGRRAYDVPAIKSLGEAFILKTKYMPASIIMMAKTLSYFGQHGGGVGVLKRALEGASTTECYNLNQLLRNGYDLVLPRSIIIDCCRQQSHFFLGRGKRIHYNELIAYWILEGYLGTVDCLDKAYEKGHSIFIELVDCQVLRKLEGGFVTLGSGSNHLKGFDRYGYGGRVSLGLADLFTDSDWEGFGRLTYTDGMVKSICKGIKKLKLSTLFLNGS